MVKPDEVFGFYVVPRTGANPFCHFCVSSVVDRVLATVRRVRWLGRDARLVREFESDPMVFELFQKGIKLSWYHAYRLIFTRELTGNRCFAESAHR